MGGPSDTERFTAFYRDNYPQVVAYVRRRSQLDPETIAADVFAIAWAKRAASVSLGLPWLYRTTRFEIQNQRRAQARAERLPATDRVEPVADDPSRLTDRLWLRSMLEQLSEEDQEVLRLLYWEDLNHGAAALVLSCRPGTVAVRAHRARSRLQKLIDDQADGLDRSSVAHPAHPAPQPGSNYS